MRTVVEWLIDETVFVCRAIALHAVNRELVIMIRKRLVVDIDQPHLDSRLFYGNGELMPASYGTFGFVRLLLRNRDPIARRQFVGIGAPLLELRVGWMIVKNLPICEPIAPRNGRQALPLSNDVNLGHFGDHYTTRM